MSFGLRVDELYVDAQAIAGTLHLAFKNGRHAEQRTNFGNREIRTESLDRGARDNLEVPQFR